MIRILVVDDEQEVCDLLQEFLSKKNYEVLTATEAESALRLVESNRPHMVLLDIRMPQKDGITLLKEIKKIDREIGVIMVSAVKDEAVARRALDPGADGYITKPIDLDYLETNVLIKRLLL
ncbi:MAG: response regulator [Candidatus Omnitrophota bacterium]